MAIQKIEIIRGSIPLVSPFVTSYGTEHERNLLYVHVIGDDADGWGECVALTDPLYTSEYVDGCDVMIRKYLLPMISAVSTVEDFLSRARSIRGHNMAKAAVENALLDYELQQKNISLAAYLGAARQRVPSGVSIGIQRSIDELLRVVGEYVAEGYVRVKLKIDKGRDIEHVRAVREEFGPDLLLQVDANSAYSVDDVKHLAKLDEFNLLLIEQPLPEEDLLGHAVVAKSIATPICLDESITSFDAAELALELSACSVINIKPGRVGGILEAKRIHDLCFSQDIPVWCGGMFESGIGRAANLALAALPGFTIPSDISASKRYFLQDITEPFELVDGHIDVPALPGIGVRPLPQVLDAVVSERNVFIV